MTAPRWVVLDFETRSFCDLKKTGAWVYSEDPSTEVTCLAYALETTYPHVGIWKPSDGACPPDLAEALELGAMLVAHNVAFEKAIWRTRMVPVFGWPEVAAERWHDTLATCAYRALPLKLDKAAGILKLPEQKGHVPRKYFGPDKSGAYVEPGPDLYEYCAQDVHTEVALAKRLGRLPEAEHKVWLLDQQINSRGIALDMDYIRASQTVVDRATAPIAAEFTRITGVEKVGQVAKVQKWLHSEGVHIDNLQKATIDALLGESEDEETLTGYYPPEDLSRSLPDHVRRALQLRRLLGGAATKKLKAMRNCVASDGRARYLLQYHAAGPGRWGGRLLQPQNFPRPNEDLKTIPIDDLMAAIMSGDPAWVEGAFGVDAITAVATGLRHALVAAPGKVFMAGDFASVEARVVLALAGQTDKVEFLRNDGPIYEAMAESIYGHPVNKKDHPIERQVGKNAVLGLGYQMGAPKFQWQVKVQAGVDIDLELAKKTVTAYRTEFAPAVPKLWRGLEEAALATVQTGKPHESHGILYARHDEWLTARLPSGRKLWYFGPHLVKKHMPWSTEEKPDIRLALRCYAWKQGRWQVRDLYGGLHTENVVQGIARDLLVHCMFLVEAENMPIVLTVHDEALPEVDENANLEVLFKQIMHESPRWAQAIGIPLAAETWIGKRYRK